jgi:two-component sensor histidine kinase
MTSNPNPDNKRGLRNLFSGITSRYTLRLRQKVITVAISGLILASFVYTFAALITERTIMREEIIKKSKVVTQLASHLGELPLLSENEELIKKAISTLKHIPEVSFVELYNKEHELLALEGDFSPPPREHPVKTEISIIERSSYFDLCTRVYTIKAREDIDIFQDISESKELKEHIGWIRIGFSKAYMKQAEESIIYKGLLIAVIFTLTSITLLYKLLTAATKPLTTLSNAVESVRKGSYPEIKISSSDEIGTLTAEFNRMSRTIKEREEMLLKRANLSAFVADIGIVLTESGPLQTILQRCTEIMIIRLDVVLARIWIYKDYENILELSACTGIYTLSDSPQQRLLPGEFEAGMIAQKRRKHYSNTIDDLHFNDRKWATQKGIVSFAGYPIVVENQLVGVIDMFAKKPLTEDTIDIMDSVADEIALGIQHKLVEQKIKASLNEKEVLLREIHHRVKNNMQVISSLLSLQSEYIRDKQYIDILSESKNRIKSMALVHEKLYQSKDLANIDFNDYITTLANSLFSFYRVTAGNISVNIDVKDVLLGVDTAMPCGLVVNELLSNSLKHAFPEGRRGEISITLKKSGVELEPDYELIVSDNGVGIPEGLDIGKTKSLGLQLITTLVSHQLQGKLNLIRTDGTKFHIRFKEIKYAKRI